MSVSIYYTAKRDHPPSPTEQDAINSAIAQFAIEDQLEGYFNSGQGYNWESFCVYDPKEPTETGVIFEGATKLPDNSEDAMWEGLQHWCHLLTIIRRLLFGATWDVRVDDHVIVWDEVARSYDPSQ